MASRSGRGVSGTILERFGIQSGGEIVDPYATHIPTLCAAFSIAPEGRVLELGGGVYSTPILHAMCAAQKRELVTLETDLKWVSVLKQFESENHKVILGRTLYWHWVTKGPWALVFVDCEVGDRKLALAAEALLCCPIVVIHDTEDPTYQYEEIWPLYRYRVDHKRLSPWTSVVSNIIDLGLALPPS